MNLIFLSPHFPLHFWNFCDRLKRMPEILSGAMGQQMFTVKVKTEEEKDEFIEFVHAKI